jgi:hypothetical protein
MAALTDTQTIRAARAAHHCSWCGERINAGETYKRWRFFHNGDAGTCKMHPECFDAMEEERRSEGGGCFEFMYGDNERPKPEPNAVFSGAGATDRPQQDGLSPASAATHS